MLAGMLDMVRARRIFILWFAAILLGSAPCTINVKAAQEPSSLRLIMVEEAGCRFCRKWNTDVGGAYPASPEGQFAPLQRVNRGAPEIAGFAPAVYTPTFILVRENAEIGRITGYPGESFFWEELAPLLTRAGFAPADKRGKS